MKMVNAKWHKNERDKIKAQAFFTSYAFTTTVLKHFTKIITQDCAPEQHKILWQEMTVNY